MPDAISQTRDDQRTKGTDEIIRLPGRAPMLAAAEIFDAPFTDSPYAKVLDVSACNAALDRLLGTGQPAAPHPAGEKRANGLAWRTGRSIFPGRGMPGTVPFRRWAAKITAKARWPVSLSGATGTYLERRQPLDVVDCSCSPAPSSISVCC